MYDDPAITIYAHTKFETRHKFEFIVTRLVKRENTDTSPLNFTGMGFDYTDQSLADLELRGHFSTVDGAFVAFDEAVYNCPFTVDLRRAKAMLAMLTKINKALLKSEAREPGDVFMAFCRAVGATGTIIQRSNNGGTSFRDSTWDFDTLAAGRDQLRAMIKDHPQS